INVYGLNDAFAGGPDTGKAVGNVDELSEIGYTEGTANFAAPAGATAATDLTGNRAPGFDELKPGGNPAAFMQASATTLLGSITIPTSSAAQTTFSLSDTALVNFLKLDTNGAAVVYLVNMTSNTLVQITSGETGSITDAKKPNLTMTIPEPASVGMLGMGSVLLLRRRMADVH
ncbi:MAG: PEP-CTERM sorting domain-containing protein, partial [Phycisphaerales bacterium]|nr:PEP-CTERM sorting domain-containing protein [Phycisphaerales bacterium]